MWYLVLIWCLSMQRFLGVPLGVVVLAVLGCHWCCADVVQCVFLVSGGLRVGGVVLSVFVVIVPRGFGVLC